MINPAANDDVHPLAYRDAINHLAPSRANPMHSDSSLSEELSTTGQNNYENETTETANPSILKKQDDSTDPSADVMPITNDDDDDDMRVSYKIVEAHHLCATLSSTTVMNDERTRSSLTEADILQRNELEYRQNNKLTDAANSPFTTNDMQRIVLASSFAETKPDLYPSVMREIENHGSMASIEALHQLERK